MLSLIREKHACIRGQFQQFHRIITSFRLGLGHQRRTATSSCHDLDNSHPFLGENQTPVTASSSICHHSAKITELTGYIHRDLSSVHHKDKLSGHVYKTNMTVKGPACIENSKTPGSNTSEAHFSSSGVYKSALICEREANTLNAIDPLSKRFSISTGKILHFVKLTL